MKLRAYIFREIGYRKLSFLLGLLSVTVAMTAWIGASALLRAHDRQTELLLAARARETQREMQKMEDDYRRIMRDLGYNVMILPEGQDLASLRATGHPDRTMPYEYVDRLAQGGIETLNHLLPVLQRRVHWSERAIDIILSGTPGQVPVSHLTHFLTPDGQAYRNPIMAPIPPGELVLGHSVAQSLDLHPGDETVLMGTPFRIRAVNPLEGTTDDIAVWCHLDWLQTELGLENQISLILALECVCDADSLGRIIEEVHGLVPGVAVIEFSSRVKARALARNRAAEAHATAMEAERRHRQAVGEAQRRFAAVLAPLAIAAAAAWMVFLFVGNVRERKDEIGILRAVGVREHTILAVFVFKSLWMGLAGAVLGFFAGHALGALWAGMPLISREFVTLLDVASLAAALVAAPALCILAAWFPARYAIRSDPARILCES